MSSPGAQTPNRPQASRGPSPSPIERDASTRLLGPFGTTAKRSLAPGRADLWEMLGDAEVYEAGGRISQDAEDAFTAALRLNPNSLAARLPGLDQDSGRLVRT